MTTIRGLKKKIRAAEKSIKDYAGEIKLDKKQVRRVLSSPITLLATFSAGFLGTYFLMGNSKTKKTTAKERVTVQKTEHPKKSWMPFVFEIASLGIGAIKAGKLFTKRMH